MITKKLEDLRILSLDDDIFMLDIIAQTLKEIGITHIKTYSSAKSALAYFNKHEESVDVLLCDLYMPDMDGIEMLTELAKMGFKGAVFIISSADYVMIHSMTVLAKARGIKVLGHLPKPIMMDELQIHLENLLCQTKQ
jgi:CheY-like chemotaxis protein